MRPEALYLSDIVDAADAIARFVAQTSSSAFVSDELRQSAVLQKLIIIGEAASRLPASFRSGHPQVPWPDIVAFRNFAIHEYFSVSWAIVWTTATQDVPELRDQVAAMLGSLEGQ